MLPGLGCFVVSGSRLNAQLRTQLLGSACAPTSRKSKMLPGFRVFSRVFADALLMLFRCCSMLFRCCFDAVLMLFWFSLEIYIYMEIYILSL